jgi:hypothetical protein
MEEVPLATSMTAPSGKVTFIIDMFTDSKVAKLSLLAVTLFFNQKKNRRLPVSSRI